MALQNTSFYTYIEAAFRFKLFNPKGQAATSKTAFNYLGYNLPFNRIFYYARRVLPKFYTGEFADTEEGNLLMARKVLEKLDKHQDLELESYFDPATAPEQNVPIIAEAAQESTIQQPIGATAGTSFGGMPSAPSFSSPRRMVRIVHNVPQAQEAQAEGKKLFVANSSDAVVGEKEITPTSVRSVPQGPSEIHIADENSNIVETRPIGLVSSSATTTVPGAETPTPKLVLARSDGTIIKEPQKPLGTQTLYTQDKSGIIREHSVKSPSRFSGFNSSIKNLGSRGGVFFQQNIGKHLTGDRAMNLLGKAGRTGMDALSGINNFGSGGGGGFSPLGRFGRNGGGKGFFGRFRGRGGGAGGKSSASGLSSGKKATLISGAVFFLVFMMGLIGGINGTTPTGEAAPINNPNSSNNQGLDYTLPLKTTSVQPVDIRATVKTTFPGAKLEYWDKIVQASITNGLNPALALALWIEETGASQTTLIKNGGSEIPVNGAFTRGHLGCAPTEDQTIDESLSCLFKFSAANNFTDGQFADFMAKYSGGPTAAPFSNNPNFPKNIKDWYARLVPSGTGAIMAVAPSSAPIQTIASCPVSGGKITTPSYDANPGTGHCGSSYGYSCKYCPAFGDDKHSRRAKAIDVPTNGQNVILPKINNQDVAWKLIIPPYSVDSGEGGGVGYTFQTSQGNDLYYLDMLHLNQSALVFGGDYPSGTTVATTVIDHVHMTMGKNLSSAPMAGSPSDCDPNWLPSDFMCP